jgi:Predicted transmembrane transcriptional regulator (anti-sigma factor)
VKCEDLLKAISDYIDGEIDPSICEELEKHLQDCDPCKIVVDTVRKTILLYKGTELYELPYEVKERLHKLLREKWREEIPNGYLLTGHREMGGRGSCQAETAVISE